MLKHWTLFLLSLVPVLGCTAQAQRREKIARARSEALERDLKTSEEARRKAESKLGDLESSLDESAKKLAASQDELKSLEANLKAREEELARLNAADGETALVPDDLRVKLAAALKARDEAKRDLAFARDREKNTQASLDRLKNRALQVFFENASPDTVFATDTSEMNDLFRLDGRECSVVLDLGREVEVLRGPALAKLPQLRNLDMLPMRVAYTKVLVCKSGGSLQVGRETGFFYRAQSGSNADERKLIAGRDRGMCDNRPETEARTSVFGEAQYQIVESYRGEVDGIETIDLLRSGGEILRLHTGSSVLRASSCAEMRGAVADGDIAQTACKVVLGENMPGMARIDGCFTEQKDGNAVVLKFNP